MALNSNSHTLTEDELFCDVEDEIQDFKKLEIATDNMDENIYEEYEYWDSEEDYDYIEDDDNYASSNNTRRNQNHPNQQQTSNKISNYQPSDNLFKKYSNRINLEKYDVNMLPQHTTNLLMETQKRLENERIRTKDKHDRATAEQVMDPRTRMILFKLLSRNVISEVNGCISTGKEANVYHASSKTGLDYAIKIYKTSILTFKDRDKYVTGEFRFRNGYCKHNPRKMVRTWAEKEMRNLTRMHSNGLNVPEPIILRSHVLVMSFIGKNGKSILLVN